MLWYIHATEVLLQCDEAFSAIIRSVGKAKIVGPHHIQRMPRRKQASRRPKKTPKKSTPEVVKLERDEAESKQETVGIGLVAIDSSDDVERDNPGLQRFRRMIGRLSIDHFIPPISVVVLVVAVIFYAAVASWLLWRLFSGD